jgi:hypothetical protein
MKMYIHKNTFLGKSEDLFSLWWDCGFLTKWLLVHNIQEVDKHWVPKWILSVTLNCSILSHCVDLTLYSDIAHRQKKSETQSHNVICYSRLSVHYL